MSNLKMCIRDRAMRDNLISQGYTPTDQNIKSQLQAINAKGTKGF